MRVFTKIIYFGLYIFLQGCSLQLLPNVRLDGLPTMSLNTPQGITPLQYSIQNTQNNTKAFISNLQIDTSILSTLQLNAGSNCVQLVQLQNDSVVIDFSSEGCGYGLASPSNIRFTAVYRLLYNRVYELGYRDANNQTLYQVGQMTISSDFATVTLNHLCTGSYYTSCFVSQSQGRINNIYPF